MSSAEYKIKLEAFEGPLALLMHLIDKNQIDIYDIPIAVVTEQYIAYIRTMEEFNIEVASEFLVMAATLLQIKSRMLLPKPPAAEQAEDEVDPRQELVERLLEYRRFKQMAGTLEEMMRAREQFVARPPGYFAQTLIRSGSRTEMVTAFLALLELIRLKRIKIEQDRSFGPIYLSLGEVVH